MLLCWTIRLSPLLLAQPETVTPDASAAPATEKPAPENDLPPSSANGTPEESPPATETGEIAPADSESQELAEMHAAEQAALASATWSLPAAAEFSTIEGGECARRKTITRGVQLLYELGSAGIESGSPYPGAATVRVDRGRSLFGFDIPMVLNEPVLKLLNFLQTGGRLPFHNWLARTTRYYPIMWPILVKYGLPKDLVSVALIESGLSYSAYSRARASGPWQFIQATGKLYGLKSDFWVDERRDIVKATEAAARHLKDLYKRFGDWYLVWAAYNAGENGVNRALQRSGCQDFWELAEAGMLANETRWYVPKIIAAAMIQKNPEQYGFNDISYLDPLEWDEVEVNGMADLKAAATAVGASLDAMKELNPELRFWCSPPYLKSYRLRIPKGTAEQFHKLYHPTIRDNQVTFSKYVVQSGETIGHIARATHTSVEALMNANNITNPRRVRAGRALIVPIRPCGTPLQVPETAKAQSKTRPPSKALTDKNGNH
jgi:membrane-bound lytic murein transglycosylase D